MTKPLSREALAIWNAFNDVSERVGVFEDYGDALAAVLRALVDKLGYEYHYHMDDGEGGIQYNCKNTIIDVNELNEIIHELEALK